MKLPRSIEMTIRCKQYDMNILQSLSCSFRYSVKKDLSVLCSYVQISPYSLGYDLKQVKTLPISTHFCSSSSCPFSKPSLRKRAGKLWNILKSLINVTSCYVLSMLCF